MTITLLPDAPDPATDTPTAFSQKAAASVLAQKAMVVELNAMLASLDSVAAGGALSIPYTFSTILTDSDPGAGKLRLNTTGQSSATVIRCDALSANGEDMAAVLDQFATSTSTTKGDIRLVKSGDVTKWLSFNLTAAASPSGYRNFTVAHIGGSADSPFADGDALVLFFTRAGDKGETGPAYTHPYLHVREERVSGTNGGTSVTGVNVRTLNTTVGSNTIPGASLAGDVVTLPAGTYDFEAGAPAYSNGANSGHRLSVYNHTDSMVIQSGPNTVSITNSGAPNIASCSGRFSLATSKGVKLSHYIAAGTATTGLGAATSEASVNEVYAYLILRKVA